MRSIVRYRLLSISFECLQALFTRLLPTRLIDFTDSCAQKPHNRIYGFVNAAMDLNATQLQVDDAADLIISMVLFFEY